MKNELKEIFSIYIQKVETIIVNKKAQLEKQKTKDNLSVAYINPTFWLKDRIEVLEASPEFKNLVLGSLKAFGGKSIKRMEESPATPKIRNFFRRSGCYLKIWDGNPINIYDYFDRLWNSCNEREVKTTTLHLLDSVAFPRNCISFGSFEIQGLKAKELEDLCQNEINRVFYPEAVWDTKTLSRFWFIKEEETKKEKIKIDSIDLSSLDDYEDAWFGRVKMKFPDKTIQQLALFDWNVESYKERINGIEDEQKPWIGFSIPITLTINDDLLETPQTSWGEHYCDHRTGEGIEGPFYPIDLEQNELIKLIELVQKTQRLLAIRPEQWNFIDNAMGYLAKAFLTNTYTNGLEQLLWHMAVLEALFCLKGEKIEKTIKKRLDIALGKPLSNSQFKKLYDFRSDLVHGRTESKQVYFGHLWQARDLARHSVVWFIDYLLTCDDKKEYPNRNDILNGELAVG